MRGRQAVGYEPPKTIGMGPAEREARAFVQVLPRLHLSHEWLPGIWVTMGTVVMNKRSLTHSIFHATAP
jgi:hypothetical protein